MKLTKANRNTFWSLIVLGLVVGTLGWAILEKAWLLWGWEFSLTAGPLGFDIGVLAVSIQLNPGGLLGVLGGLYLFRRI